jgi:hypothetical protein
MRAGDSEIGQALRYCHAAKPARKRNFLPCKGEEVPLAAEIAGAASLTTT